MTRGNPIIISSSQTSGWAGLRRGSRVRATVPKLPPSVARPHGGFSAGCRGESCRARVGPVQESRAHDYVVVRREGNLSPAGPADGKTVHCGTELRFLDNDVRPGQHGLCRLYSRRRDLQSRPAQPGARRYHRRCTGLEVVIGDRTVGLSWATAGRRRGARSPRPGTSAGRTDGEPWT